MQNGTAVLLLQVMVVSLVWVTYETLGLLVDMTLTVVGVTVTFRCKHQLLLHSLELMFICQIESVGSVVVAGLFLMVMVVRAPTLHIVEDVADKVVLVVVDSSKSLTSDK
tara:strand:+ start:534 stop:863 length:330 start_codon:yes stop_codon:yes gene_type:complete